MKFNLKVYGLAAIFIFITANTHAELLQIDDMNCPDKPNCVSSLVKDSAHYIEPFTFTDTPEKAMARLKTALLQEKGIMLVTNEAEVLKAEVKSLLFRFVDDVEFSLLAEKKLIHVRSSSRTGYYDFGVNRRRIERIRQRFQN